MKVSTSVYSAVTLTGGVNLINSTPIKLDLSAITYDQATLEVVITNGSITPNRTGYLQVSYAFCSDNLTAADGLTQLQLTDKQFKINMSGNALEVKHHVSDPIVIAGNYMYLWYDVSELGVGEDVVMDVNLISVEPA